MEAFWLRFNNIDLELRYQQYFTERMGLNDVRSSLMATMSYSVLFYQCSGMLRGWTLVWRCWAALHCSLLAPLPAVWLIASRRSWVRWRSLWTAAYLPHSFLFARHIMALLQSRAGGRLSGSSTWDCINASGVLWQLAMAFFYRLPFAVHVLAHVAVLAVLQLHNPRWCRWAADHCPGVLGGMYHLHGDGTHAPPVAAQLEGRGQEERFPPAAAVGDTKGLRIAGGGLLPCLHILAFAQLYLGLVVGSSLVWVLEWQSRLTFLMQVRRGTASVPSRPLLRSTALWRVLVGVAAVLPVCWGAALLLSRRRAAAGHAFL